MNVNQGLMDALGVNNASWRNWSSRCARDPQIYGSKISGSGLGDCVVGWQGDAARVGRAGAGDRGRSGRATRRRRRERGAAGRPPDAGRPRVPGPGPVVVNAPANIALVKYWGKPRRRR
jgi:hypothetical protein